MASHFEIRRTTAVFVSILLSIGVLTQCINSEAPIKKEGETTNNFAAFAGSQACAGCHQDVYESHLTSEHHRTSALATKDNVMGSFEKGSNAFAYDPYNQVSMEERDEKFYQVHYRNGNEVTSKPFDVVVGSGRKGQSFLSWTNGYLSQLPITYFTPARQWSNSPGYPPARVVFNRPVTARCMECHSTYMEQGVQTAARRDAFDQNKAIYGIECEKCHGPAAQHVKFQTANPQSKEARYVVNPKNLSRDRLLDFCSLCHGGQLSKTTPSFEFGIGDTLSNYFSRPAVPMTTGGIDVHGNQSGLLALSKCFQLTQMTCLNCHDAHSSEAGNIVAFSNRCQSCHSKGNQPECGMTHTLGESIRQNCIDCHMPRQPSHAVAVYLQGATQPQPALMRTHEIKIYPEEVKKFLSNNPARGVVKTTAANSLPTKN